jgi:tRNA nucleotidyltransferase/poly(A) polymerase
MPELDAGIQPDDFSAYAGRWIAIIGAQVVGQGGTPEQARHAAQASRFKETPHITYITPDPPLNIHPFLEDLAPAFPPDYPVYVVGGAVRDVFLKRTVTEMDFIVPAKAIREARRIADRFGGAFYALDKKRDYGRVLLPQDQEQPLILDFTPIAGKNLEDDLRSRDFTINAVAAGLQPPHPLFDPCGGIADLHAKQLRPCLPTAFSSDPIRVLRGVRFSLKFGVRPDKKTKELMRAAVDLLDKVSPERLRDELLKILAGPKPSAAVRVLDRLGALNYILPELETLKGLEQSPPHILDAWEHTLETGKQLEKILDVLSPVVNMDKTANVLMGVISHRLGRFRNQLAAHFQANIVQDRQIRSLLFLAALYHDTGKPASLDVDSEGRISFINHEAIGADLIQQRAAALNLSNLEINRLQLIVLNHMRPLWLAQVGRPPSRRAKFRFFRDTGAAGVDICLLSLADTLATFGYTISPETWNRQVDIVRDLLEAWWEHKEEEISPPPIVDGNDLMLELQLKPGPVVGRLLAAIREAQATGEVNTRRQAYEFARILLDENGPGS